MADNENVIEFALQMIKDEKRIYTEHLNRNPRIGLKKLIFSLIDQYKRQIDKLSGMLDKYPSFTDFSIDFDHEKYILPPDKEISTETGFLRYILEKERKVQFFFEDLSAAVDAEEIKLLFGRMAEEERKHVALITDWLELTLMQNS